MSDDSLCDRSDSDASCSSQSRDDVMSPEDDLSLARQGYSATDSTREYKFTAAADGDIVKTLIRGFFHPIEFSKYIAEVRSGKAVD